MKKSFTIEVKTVTKLKSGRYCRVGNIEGKSADVVRLIDRVTKRIAEIPGDELQAQIKKFKTGTGKKDSKYWNDSGFQFVWSPKYKDYLKKGRSKQILSNTKLVIKYLLPKEKWPFTDEAIVKYVTNPKNAKELVKCGVFCGLMVERMAADHFNEKFVDEHGYDTTKDITLDGHDPRAPKWWINYVEAKGGIHKYE